MFFFFMLRRPPVSTCTPTRSLHYALPIFLFGDGDDFARQFAGDLRLLIPERATAVCSPGFRSRFGPFGRIEELLRVPLIHLEGDSGERWFTWQSWLRPELRRVGQECVSTCCYRSSPYPYHNTRSEIHDDIY